MKVLLIVCLSLCFTAAFVTATAIDTVVVEASTQDSTKAEEKQAILATVPEECHQPKEIGRCFALFHRYAFNVETLQCEEFIYGGCAGNENNFETLLDCEQKCLKKAVATSSTEENASTTTENVNKTVNQN